MKKFIQKIAAMAISAIMAASSAMPAMAATAQDYVPMVTANGIALASAETSTDATAQDYNTGLNSVTIKIVDEDTKTALEVLDSSVLVSGHMGGIDLSSETTRTYNSTAYSFSHFEYVTSVRNYVASYQSKFEFYVDPPMEIWAIYKNGTPAPPAGPIVGMYKDPDIKTVNGSDLTFFYLSEAHTEDLGPSSNKPDIFLGRSTSDESSAGNYEKFSVQAGNIYSSNYNYQFIVASAIKNSPIDINASANLTVANAQIRTWDFGTTAFSSVASSTGNEKITVNGLYIGDLAGTSTDSVTIDQQTFTKGLKLNAASSSNNARYFEFNANKGDVIEIYGKGTSSNAASLSVANAVYSSGNNGSIGNSSSSTCLKNTYIASSTGSVNVSLSGNNGNIYCIKVNPYTISANTDTPVDPPVTETVTQTFTITPDGQSVTINGQTVANGGSLTLTKGNTYTVTAPSGYTVKSVGGVAGSTSFTAETDNASIAIALEKQQDTPIEVTQTFTITPPTQSVTINGQTVANNGTLPLSPNTTYDITAPSGYTASPTSFTTGSSDGTTAIDLTADTKAASISGTIKGSDTNSGIAATVSLFNGTAQVGESITAAANGTFTFSNITTGIAYILKAVMTGYDDGQLTLPELTVDGITNADITLTKTGTSGSVTSTIWNFNDSAMSNFVNSAVASDTATATYNGLTYTAGGGSATSPTVTEASVTFANGTTGKLKQAIKTGGSSTLPSKRTFSFTASKGQKVRVYYTSGGTSKYPQFISGTSGTTQSGDGGSDTSTVLTCDFDVTADGTQYLGSASDLRFLAIELYSTGPRDTGTITANITSASAISSVTATGEDGVSHDLTLSNGAYKSGNLAPGKYTVIAVNDYDDSVSYEIILDASDKTIDLTIPTTKGALRIKVVASDRTTAISNADVIAVADGITYNLKPTDTAGIYELSGLSQNTYAVTATYNGISNETTVNVFVEAGQTKEGTVELNITDYEHIVNMNKAYDLTQAILSANNNVENPIWNTESDKTGKFMWHYVNGAMTTAFLNLSEADVPENSTYYDYVKSFASAYFDDSGAIKDFPDKSTSYTRTSSGEYFQLDGVKQASDYYRFYDKLKDTDSTLANRFKNAGDNVFTHIFKTYATDVNKLTSDDCNKALGSYEHKGSNAGYTNQVWLDGIYMAMPFYIQYANHLINATDKQNAIDVVYTQFNNAYTYLRESTDKTTDNVSVKGLYYHGLDGSSTNQKSWATNEQRSQSFWLRGQAWYAMAMVDVIEYMPEGEQKNNMINWFKEYMEAVVRWQDSETGMWRQVVDQGNKTATLTVGSNTYTYDNYFETSGSSGMAYALMKGARLGYLDSSYYNYGLEAFDGICNNKLTYDSTNTSYGMKLTDMCRVAGLGDYTTIHTPGVDSTTVLINKSDKNTKSLRDGTFGYYLMEDRCSNDGKGFAPFLMAYSEVLKHEKGVAAN